MFEEATLYSPLICSLSGRVSVLFAKNHPGYHDSAYQEHRARIAEVALAYRPGMPIPDIAYTDEEHDLWRIVSAELRKKHQRYACAEFLQGAQRLALPTDRLTQLAEASARIERLTGFTFSPAAGLVDAADFYGSLADRRFQATQFIRHRSFPSFSPEPDMIHEVVGHGSALADDRLADIYETFGRTARRLTSREALDDVSRVFWFTMEYGLVRERGEVRACGASLLSSCGELEQFRNANIRPLSLPEMISRRYTVDSYQEVLFCADSFNHLQESLGDYLSGIDDESTTRAEGLCVQAR
jgi:phenylalanine-4-hydroxylase